MDDWRLLFGGAWADVRIALGLSRADGRPRIGAIAALGIGLYLVVLGLAMIEPGGGAGRLRDALGDYGMAVRLLLAIPILLLDEFRVDRRIAVILPTFRDCHLFAAPDLAAWEARVRATRGRMTGGLNLLALAGVAITLAVLALIHPANGPAAVWMEDPSGPNGLSWAGLWYTIVARPIFLFLGFLWAWRWIALGLLVYRTARSPLTLQVSHPDQLGGLAIFMELITAVMSIIFTLSAVMSAGIFYEMVHRGAHLRTFAPVLIGLLVLAVLFALGPFFSFIPVLAKLRRQALYSFGVLAAEHSTLFERRWFHKHPADQELLGASEISSLTDLASAYVVAGSIRTFPLGRGTILSVVMAAGLPMVPVVLVEVPLREIVSRILKLLM